MKRLKSQSGKALEELLGTVNAEYQRRKIALIHKVEAPTLTMGSGTARRTIYLANPFLDYVGCLASGRMVVVEAKSTDGDRLAINSDPKRKDGISGTQYGAGCRWHDFGALVGIVWQHGQRTIWIPWRVVRQELEEGTRSLSPDDGIPIPAGMGYIILDWIVIALASEK